MRTTADTQEKPVLATPSPSVQATQFDQDVSQVLKSAMNVQQSKDGIEAAFTLAPDHLGKVDVKVSIKDGHVTAEFLASTSSGKNLLETNVHALRAALETQGLQVEKINISQQNTSSFMGTFSQKGDSNTRQGQQDSRKRNERIVNNQEKEYRDFGQDTGWVSQINTTA
jgi:flagellar hook-length control protein FliK